MRFLPIVNFFLENLIDLMPILVVIIGLIIPVSIAQIGDYVLDASTTAFCFLPFTSSVGFCQSDNSATWAALAFLLRTEASGFGRLLDQSTTTYSLALDLTDARVAAGDLLPLVKSSGLERREELHDLIVDFADDAKDTSRYLQQMTARITSGSDRIIAAHGFMSRILFPQATTLSASPFCDVITTILPSAGDVCTPHGPDSADVTRAYEYTLETVETVLRNLIQSAQVVLFKLESLDARLLAIADVALAEGLAVSQAKEEVLGHLWTYLGGNQSKLSNFNNDLKVLRCVDQYRKASLAYVEMVLHTLEGMQSGAEETRRIASGALLSDDISFETVLEIIDIGTQRLKVGRSKATGSPDI